MRIHHLSCGSMCPHGGRLIGGEGGLRSKHEIVCHCLLIESADGLVLVDSGFGSGDTHNPAQLGRLPLYTLHPRLRLEETAIAQVEALGFAAADVRHIVSTHLDIDHAGGLPDFPAAAVHVLKAEKEAAVHPGLRDRSRYPKAHLEHGPRWAEHDSGAGGESWFGFESLRILPGLDVEIALIPLVGHSRGHCGVAVNLGERWLLHCGDAYFSPSQIQTPPSCPPLLRVFQRLVADDNAARHANTERLRELAANHGEEVSLFGSHDRHELARERAARVAAAA